MNIALWIVAGGVLGWFGYVMLNANEGRGVAASIVIGALGAFAGGKVLAPMLGAAAVTPNEFSQLSMVVAAGSAMACLGIADRISKYFNV